VSTPPPAPTCTLHVLKEPSVDTDCTFKEHTKTATAYTDCGGCALQTRVLGVGLVSISMRMMAVSVANAM
jgi:hypothetical protein